MGATTTAQMTTTNEAMNTIEMMIIAVTTTTEVGMSPILVVVISTTGLLALGVAKRSPDNMTADPKTLS